MSEEELLTERFCAGCGRRKVKCPCWMAGAGDEAVMAREGLTLDQAALIDFMRTFMQEGCGPVHALVRAMSIEFAASDASQWRRLRTAWRVFRSDRS